jgi:hypothetical protein
MRALAATWSVRDVDDEFFDATGAGGAALEQLARSGERVSGARLTELAGDTLQVIWGEFTGYEAVSSGIPWVVIRAIDSSYFEVATDDDDAVARIRACFKDVMCK